jgi:hypothetical protein
VAARRSDDPGSSSCARMSGSTTARRLTAEDVVFSFARAKTELVPAVGVAPYLESYLERKLCCTDCGNRQRDTLTVSHGAEELNRCPRLQAPSASWGIPGAPGGHLKVSVDPTRTARAVAL